MSFVPVVNTVVRSVSATVPSDSLASVTSGSASPDSLSPISKRAQKGKKDPPGSRDRRRKEAAAAAVARASAQAASLAAELAETNRILADAVEARDSARSDCSRACAKAEEWKQKYRIAADAASRDRLEAVRAHLLADQRAQNCPSSSASLPAPRSLIPAPYPQIQASSRALQDAEPPC